MTNAEFEQQIDWFQEHFQIVDLEECQRRIRSGSNDRPTLAITFDDGYAENCEYALPLLIERRIPATYFVTTHHTTNQQPFGHDVDLGNPLPVNSIESLRSLDLAGIEIGGHTRTHASIGHLTDPEAIVDEVLTSSREMESLIGRPVRYFAFPFGLFPNLHADAFHLLKREGLLGVCSAYGGYNHMGDDAFHLQRIHADPSFARIRNWLTLDPRIMKVKRFDYSGATIDWESVFDSPKDARPGATDAPEANPNNPSATLPTQQDSSPLDPSNIPANENA